MVSRINVSWRAAMCFTYGYFVLSQKVPGFLLPTMFGSATHVAKVAHCPALIANAACLSKMTHYNSNISAFI